MQVVLALATNIPNTLQRYVVIEVKIDQHRVAKKTIPAILLTYRHGIDTCRIEDYYGTYSKIARG